VSRRCGEAGGTNCGKAVQKNIPYPSLEFSTDLPLSLLNTSPQISETPHAPKMLPLRRFFTPSTGLFYDYDLIAIFPLLLKERRSTQRSIVKKLLLWAPER
jgi:hypothetical protein